MARTGAGPFFLDSRLGIIRRASCESDFRSLYADQYCTIRNSSNENSYAIRDKSEPAYGNGSSFSYSETDPDGNLESNDD